MLIKLKWKFGTCRTLNNANESVTWMVHVCKMGTWVSLGNVIVTLDTWFISENNAKSEQTWLEVPLSTIQSPGERKDGKTERQWFLNLSVWSVYVRVVDGKERLP